jgi:hypothetical protein
MLLRGISMTLQTFFENVRGFEIPNLFAPAGTSKELDEFTLRWKQMSFGGIAIVGRKDNSNGCFTLTAYGRGWIVAYYRHKKPNELFKTLRQFGDIDEAADSYFETDRRNQFISSDLVGFLNRR